MRTPRTPSDLGFDRHDQHRLTRAVGSCPDARTFRRLQAVLLVARGRTVPEVARLTDLKPWAIYAWVRRYLTDHRPEALVDCHRSGRPPAAPAITDARIVRPTQCPELNPVDHLWRELKRLIAANRQFRTIDEESSAFKFGRPVAVKTRDRWEWTG
jgi:Helix-turn-helix domain